VPAYLTTPIKQPDLLDAILNLLMKRLALSESTLEPNDDRLCSRRSSRHLRILVAEDNMVNQRLATRLLEKQGHYTVVANDGLEALIAIENERFDLVFMDVQMPNLDGFEAMAQLRQNEKVAGGHMPIVAMTAHAMKGDRERCLDAGFDDYVSKPIHAEELFNAIERTISHEPESATRDLPAAICDKTTALANIDNDNQLLREIAEVFVDDCPRMMMAIRDAVTFGDATQLYRAAHALRGSVASFSAPCAFEAALALETMARSESLADAPKALDRLEAVVQRLVEELAQVTAATVLSE
jgi:two-component system sensor histidine kinase/response regulator